MNFAVQHATNSSLVGECPVLVLQNHPSYRFPASVDSFFLFMLHHITSSFAAVIVSTATRDHHPTININIGCNNALLRFRHKKHLVSVGKASLFGVKYMFWSPQKRIEMISLPVKKCRLWLPKKKRQEISPQRETRHHHPLDLTK